MKIVQILKNNINKVIIIGLVVIVILVVSIKYYLDSTSSVASDLEVLEVEEEKNNKDDKKEEGSKVSKVYVDIKGAIKSPGVYELESNKKVMDVVYMAGGLTDEADTTFVNLAKKVSDEMVVIIYTKDQIKEAREKEFLAPSVNDTCVCPEITNDACLDNNTSKKEDSSADSKIDSSEDNKTDNTTDEKININTASLEELQTLSGIGESKAQAIIDYREENGEFSKPEDILEVSGIGETLYEKIKDNITV